jgi:hypothetical protein
MRTTFLGLILAAVLAGGCDKGQATAGSINGEDGKGGEAADPDRRLGSKLGGYIECENGLSSSALGTRDRYVSWFKDPTKPTKDELQRADLYEIHGAETCLKFLDGVDGVQPKLDKLDPAGKAYAAALRKVLPLAKDAREYYEQKNWKDDGGAKGRSMHQPLLDAFGEMTRTHHAMLAEFETVNAGYKERDLARLKAAGPPLRYHQANVMMQAEKLLKVGLHRAVKLDELQPVYDGFDKAATEMRAWAAKSKAVTDKVMMWSHFESQTAEYGKAAKDRLRRVRDGKPFTKDELERLGTSTASWVEGGPGKLLETYNSLVDWSNRLR